MGIFIQIIFTILTAVLWFLKANEIIGIGWFWVILPVCAVPLFWAFIFILGYIKEFLEWIWEKVSGK